MGLTLAGLGGAPLGMAGLGRVWHGTTRLGLFGDFVESAVALRGKAGRG